MLEIKSFKGGYDSNFSYILYDKDTKEAMIIDTALNPEILLQFINENKLKLKFAVVMHSHFDHRVNLNYYRENKISLYGSEKLIFDIDKELKDGDELKLGSSTLKIISAPGHTPDCILIYVEGKLFTTDVLFIDACGRCDLDGGDAGIMYDTLYDKILKLPEETIIYPGHDYGSVPFESLADQKKTNPYLQAKNKKDFVEGRM